MKRLLSTTWDLPELPLAAEWPGTAEERRFSADSVAGTFELSVSPATDRISLQRLARFEKNPGLADCQKKLCLFDDRFAAIATKRAGTALLTLLIFPVSPEEEALVTYITGPGLGPVERRLAELQTPLPGLAAATMRDGNIMLGNIAVPTPLDAVFGPDERAPIYESAKGITELGVAGAFVMSSSDDAVLVAQLFDFKATPLRASIERRAEALWESKLASQILSAGQHGFLTSDIVWSARWESAKRVNLEYLVQDEARQTWSLMYSVAPSKLALLDELEARNATLKPPRPSEDPIVSSKTIGP